MTNYDGIDFFRSVREFSSQKVRKSQKVTLNCLPALALYNVYWDGGIAYKSIRQCGAPTITVILRFRHQQTEPSSNSPARSRARL